LLDVVKNDPLCASLWEVAGGGEELLAKCSHRPVDVLHNVRLEVITVLEAARTAIGLESLGDKSLAQV
jgi:hypothetical protein